MEDTTSILLATPLFGGFSPEELGQIIKALSPKRGSYQKGETLLLGGYENRDIFVLLAGHTEAVKETRAGEQFRVARMGPGGILGDVLAGSHTTSPVTVRATSPCTALLFHYPALLAAPSLAPGLHRRLLANLVALIADKYFALDQRVDLLLTRGLRRRIAAFLLGEMGSQPNHTASIPQTRAALADFLGCERSALSRELSRMQGEGLIRLGRKSITLLQRDALAELV